MRKALLTCLLLTGSLAAGGEGPPSFSLHLADGTTLAGPLTKVGPDWSMRLGGPRPSLSSGAEVISLRRQSLRLPPNPSGEQVILSNGDRVPLTAGQPLRLAGDYLECVPRPPLRVRGDGPLKLPLAAVALIWIAPPEGTAEPLPLLRRLLAEKRDTDVLYLRNGDTALGTVIALEEQKGCRLEFRKKQTEVPFGRMAAIAFSTELLARPRAKGAYAHLVLGGGARISLTSAQVDPERQVLTGNMVLGTAVEVPLAQVASLDLRRGRAVFLSDLEPRDYRFMSFLGQVAWPLVKDGSVAGHDLVLAGSTYDKGLGLHSKAEVTYALAGQYDRLEALVGLDEVTGRHGSAKIRVLVDGKAKDLGWDGALKGGDNPMQVHLDLRGARELTLVVDFGRQGDVQAHVDWADAAVIKSKAP
jgi:hypothetical protein